MRSLPCTEKIRRKGAAALIALACLGALGACSSTTNPGAVDVTRRQLLIVPSETIERMAAINFHEQNEKARAAGKLLTSGDAYKHCTPPRPRPRA